MADDSLCVGDYVCLYSEESYGFCYGTQSSSIFNEVAVGSRQARDKPELPDVQVVTFKVCIANRYKLNKKLRKLQVSAQSDPNNLALRNNVSQASIGANAENEDNVVEQKRQKGKKVLYGQIIQLRHMFTKKYIHVSATQTSSTESSNMKVEMLPFNAKQAQFRIMPRYKVKSEGDVVQVDDQIVLESVKSPGQFLHVSKAMFSKQSVYCGSLELNLSVRQSGFTIYRHYHPLPEDKIRLNAGVPIRLFHKEIEAYLVAEGLFNEKITEDVHFRVRVVDQANPKTLFPSTSAITYWQLELEEGVVDGSVIRWEQQCRIKHMITRKYLMVDANRKVGLTDRHTDPLTVFKLHSVIKEKDIIEYDTYCRIEHAVTGLWLHADNEEYVRQQMQSSSSNDQSMEGLKWTTSQLRQISTIAEKQYDDAFTLQQVESEHVANFNYMAGMVPTLQKLIEDKKSDFQLNAKHCHDIVSTLSELKNFMIVQGEPSKNRQKLLRNLRIVELLVQLLQLRYRGNSDAHHMINIFVEAYDTLYAYLMGDSRKNELYIAKHIPFFQAQIEYAGAVGVNAAHMVMELIKDNRKIVDRITHSHIDSFVKLLGSDKNYRYLDLLTVLCVCDGVSIPDNQTYITKKWLESGKSAVFYTDLGQKLQKDPALKSKASMFESNVVYVCTNNSKQRHWVALHDFAQESFIRMELAASSTPTSAKHSKPPNVVTSKITMDKAGKEDEEFMFLTHQLDLFQKLCYGRNNYAIDVITKKLGYLTWEEAFLCLTNEQLPDELRAKYCSLIIGMFVDVGVNTSILDHINLTYIYEDIQTGPAGGIENRMMEADQQTPRSSETMAYFPQLSDWIAGFLDSNKDMTAALIGHNMLVEQVLRLVHYLVKYGYYGKTEDIKKLLPPLLSLLDGRNDKPYPRTGREGPEFQQVLNHYRTVGRYQQSPETKAIVDAKHQAMEVLDLFLNFRFNTRLERFVSMFKEVHHQAQQGVSTPDTAHLLYGTYELDTIPHADKAALRTLTDIFEESNYFKGLALEDILVDLSQYQYNKMITQSMALLNRFYSAHDNLFKRAVQAQVLVTDTSCAVLGELRRMLPNLRRLAGSKLNDEQAKDMAYILDKMNSFCCLADEPQEPHPMGQSILYNHEILSDIFDIISQDIDIRLLDQYRGVQMIFQKCFQLLQVMARGNEVVQQRLFDRLDSLLQVEGAEPEMADAITEVFTGNKTTCLKILPHQIQKIMSLVASHTSKAPQFLDLLNAVVKVEELDLPLKRNQGYVMTYFMQYRSEVAYIIDQPMEDRKKLLVDGDRKELVYLISLVDLLATCAEGENRFIESICQTIFGVDELLDILNNESISNNFKRPYLRFFLWVYLNTAGGMIESGSGDLPHDPRVWQYINGLNANISALNGYCKNEPEKVKHMLKKAPSKSDNGKASKRLESKFKLPPINGATSVEQTDADEHIYHASLHYMFEAVLPFLQVFFRGYYSPDRVNFPGEADHVDKLANTLVAFSDVIGPLVSSSTHMKVMIACMNSVLSASTLPVKDPLLPSRNASKVMEQFQEKYGGQEVVQDIKSDARRKYEREYAGEEELNAQLNVFAVNFSMAYGGQNTVEKQLGIQSDREYTEIGGDDELPLGEEFQRFVAMFVDDTKTAGQMYILAEKLVEQLDISASHTSLSEKDRVEQQRLDVKCLQLLRALIHNEIVKLPEDWELDLKSNKKQLQKIEAVQIALNKHDVILKVLPHLSMNGDEIIREVLSFLASMLFGGNYGVQQSLIRYFFGTREEKFFVAVKNRMQLSAIATKEKRALMAQHQAKIEEALAQHKALAKAMQAGNAAAAEIMAANKLAGQLGSTIMDMKRSKSSLGAAPSKKPKKNLKSRYGSNARLGSQKSLNSSTGSGLLTSNAHLGSRLLSSRQRTRENGIEMSMMSSKKEDKQPLLTNNNRVSPIEIKVDSPEVIEEDDMEDLKSYLLDQENEDSEYKDDGYIELVLRVLGLMCDGQNKQLQDYLREQPDNIKSFNLVAETARFLSLIYSNINKNTVDLVTQIFDTLVEFTSGNPQNQSVVFDNKVCDYINHILRGGAFQRCTPVEILTLKSSIVTLIKSMIEENIPQANKKTTLATEVVESLDASSLHEIMIECFRSSQSRTLDEDLKELTTTVGFKYYHVLVRMIDLSDQVSKQGLVKTEFHHDAWLYYEQGTLSIEILKHDVLNKIYFRVKDKSVLREEIKEKFKYEVDRSSPSNKIREFMDWSRDIMKDIKIQKKILSYRLAKFFVRQWYLFNFLMILLSIVIAITIVAGVRQPVYNNGTINYEVATAPVFAWTDLPILQYCLFGLHNLLSFFILIGYFLSNTPSPPNFKAIGEWFRKKCGPSRSQGGASTDQDEVERESNLQVKIISFKTFYYVAIFVLSITGTIWYGYTFAFHLLHLADNNQLLSRVIKAITKNGWSLIWVGVLILIVLYVFALLSFVFFRDLYVSSKGLYCETMYQCYLTVVHRGFIMGPFEYFSEIEDGKSFEWHALKALFDLAFFIVITTIGLNVIFGIIVDTFSELRDSKWQTDQDMANVCFICSRSSYDFEHHGEGFEHHVKNEHNQWAYLFFFIHLSETRSNDYSALELHVANLLEKTNYDFFPLNRALSLQQTEDSKELKLETLMYQVSYLVNKMKEDEAARQQEIEIRRQQEWLSQHQDIVTKEQSKQQRESVKPSSNVFNKTVLPEQTSVSKPAPPPQSPHLHDD